MDIARPDLKRRKQLRRRILTGFTAVTLAGATIGAIALTSSAPTVQASDVLIDTVQRGRFSRKVRGPGTLVPGQMRWVIARTDASVERLLVRPGASVKADSPIIELSNPEVQERLLAASAAFAAAAGDHDALQADLQSDLLERQLELAAIAGEHAAAEVEEEASRRALESGVLAEVQYRKAAIALQQSTKRVRIAEQRVLQARTSIQAQLRASRARLDQLASTRALRQLEADALRITAGIDGVVQQIGAEEGQRVTSGSNLARIAGEGALIAELRIPETQAADLAVGQATTIGIGRSRVPGRVRRINPVVEQGTILVEVDLTGPLPDGARPGQSVDGSVLTEQLADVLYTGRPVNASPQSESSIFKLVAPGTAQRAPVRFGKDSVNQIQVVDGLKEGDRVILSDMSEFDEFNEVSVE
ncbi:MAG: efflux RND transporter periplasmic adaptor subunit [Lysobacter sp.]